MRNTAWYWAAVKPVTGTDLWWPSRTFLDCPEAITDTAVTGFTHVQKHSCLGMLRSKYWAKMRQVDRTLFYLASSDLEYWQNNYGKVQKFARMAKVKAVDKSQNGSFSIVETSRFHGRNHTLSHNRQWFEISESEIQNADVSSSEAYSNWLTAILNWSCLLSRNDLTYLTFQSTMFAAKWIFL